jgi:hypothetical protein
LHEPGTGGEDANIGAGSQDLKPAGERQQDETLEKDCTTLSCMLLQNGEFKE